MLKIPFDKCGVKQMVGEEDGWIGHTLVVQHDDWLIFPGRRGVNCSTCKILVSTKIQHNEWHVFPGDLAFTVQCNHSDQVKTFLLLLNLKLCALVEGRHLDF